MTEEAIKGPIPTAQIEPPPMMTTAEVADVLRTPAETVRYWRHIGKGPRSFKVGRRVLYRRSDVEAWLEAQYAEAAPTADPAA